MNQFLFKGDVAAAAATNGEKYITPYGRDGRSQGAALNISFGMELSSSFGRFNRCNADERVTIYSHTISQLHDEEAKMSYKNTVVDLFFSKAKINGGEKMEVAFFTPQAIDGNSETLACKVADICDLSDVSFNKAENEEETKSRLFGFVSNFVDAAENFFTAHPEFTYKN